MQRPELLLLGLALRPDLAPQRETCPDRASARPANDTELAVSFSSTSSALRGAPRRRRRGSISSHSSYLGLGVQVGSDRRAVSTSLELSSTRGRDEQRAILAVGRVCGAGVLLDALRGPVDRLREAKRERNPHIVLVLLHWWGADAVHLRPPPPRSRLYPRR